MTARMVNGYWSLGGPRIPVPLRGIALTDRADGTVWALQNDGTDRIKIVSPLPTGFKGRTFPALAGPRIDTPAGSAQMIVRSGRLGFDLDGSDVLSRPVYAGNRTRATAENDTIFEIKAPSSNVPANLAYETEPDL